MRKVVKFLVLIIVLNLLLAFTHSKAYASHKVFQENFNSYSNGAFPNGWVRADDPNRTPCSANWAVQNGMLGIKINQGFCTTNLVPNDTLWNNLGDNYTFELDVKFVSGTDHNVAFRFTPSTPTNKFYELHFQSPGDFYLFDGISHTEKVRVSGSYANGQTYRIKIIVNKGNVIVYVNNILIRDFTATPDIYSTGKIALRATTGADSNSETYFDNIVVTSIDDASTDLNVPLLKQTANPWKSQEYDTAHIWNPSDITINSWGCAMTSAAMVFKYHGINKLPDGTILDPGSLNSWLNSQKDGYVGTGWVNWLALSRLSKLAKSVNGVSFDALEYKRISGENKTQLTNDLINSIPGILQVPGHFIVAKGINNDTFNINDPFYNRSTLNEGYSNSFLALGRFIPSNTDLSYIMLVSDPDVDIIVLDNNGNQVGEQFVQDSIINPNDPNQQNTPIKMYYYPQPSSGNYQISTSSSNDKFHTLSSYLYDSTGEVDIQVINVLSNSSYSIEFDKTNKNKSKTEKIVTYDSAIEDVEKAESLNLINHGLAASLIEHLKNSQKKSVSDKSVSIHMLDVGIKQLNSRNNHKTQIDPTALEILNYDFNYLKTY